MIPIGRASRTPLAERGGILQELVREDPELAHRDLRLRHIEDRTAIGDDFRERDAGPGLDLGPSGAPRRWRGRRRRIGRGIRVRGRRRRRDDRRRSDGDPDRFRSRVPEAIGRAQGEIVVAGRRSPARLDAPLRRAGRVGRGEGGDAADRTDPPVDAPDAALVGGREGDFLQTFDGEGRDRTGRAARLERGGSAVDAHPPGIERALGAAAGRRRAESEVEGAVAGHFDGPEEALAAGVGLQRFHRDALPLRVDDRGLDGEDVRVLVREVGREARRGRTGEAGLERQAAALRGCDRGQARRFAKAHHDEVDRRRIPGAVRDGEAEVLAGPRLALPLRAEDDLVAADLAFEVHRRGEGLREPAGIEDADGEGVERGDLHAGFEQRGAVERRRDVVHEDFPFGFLRVDGVLDRFELRFGPRRRPEHLLGEDHDGAALAGKPVDDPRLRLGADEIAGEHPGQLGAAVGDDDGLDAVAPGAGRVAEDDRELRPRERDRVLLELEPPFHLDAVDADDAQVGGLDLDHRGGSRFVPGRIAGRDLDRVASGRSALGGGLDPGVDDPLALGTADFPPDDRFREVRGRGRRFDLEARPAQGAAVAGRDPQRREAPGDEIRREAVREAVGRERERRREGVENERDVLQERLAFGRGFARPEPEAATVERTALVADVDTAADPGAVLPRHGEALAAAEGFAVRPDDFEIEARFRRKAGDFGADVEGGRIADVEDVVLRGAPGGEDRGDGGAEHLDREAEPRRIAGGVDGTDLHRDRSRRARELRPGVHRDPRNAGDLHEVAATDLDLEHRRLGQCAFAVRDGDRQDLREVAAQHLERPERRRGVGAGPALPGGAALARVEGEGEHRSLAIAAQFERAAFDSEEAREDAHAADLAGRDHGKRERARPATGGGVEDERHRSGGVVRDPDRGGRFGGTLREIDSLRREPEVDRQGARADRPVLALEAGARPDALDAEGAAERIAGDVRDRDFEAVAGLPFEADGVRAVLPGADVQLVDDLSRLVAEPRGPVLREEDDRFLAEDREAAAGRGREPLAVDVEGLVEEFGFAAVVDESKGLRGAFVARGDGDVEGRAGRLRRNREAEAPVRDAALVGGDAFLETGRARAVFRGERDDDVAQGSRARIDAQRGFRREERVRAAALEGLVVERAEFEAHGDDGSTAPAAAEEDGPGDDQEGDRRRADHREAGLRLEEGLRGDALADEELLEVGLDLRDRLVAGLRFLLETLEDDGVEPLRLETRGVLRRRVGRRRAVLVEDRDRVALEGRPAGHHHVEDAAEAVDVGADIGDLAVRLLRAHRGDGAFAVSAVAHRLAARAGDRRGSAAAATGRDARDAEVRDLDAAAVHEHVRGLQVAVDDRVVALVGVAEAVQDAVRKFPEALAGDRPVPLDDLGEGGAVHVLHRDVRRAALGAGVEDRDDVLAAQGGGGAGFAEEGLLRALLFDPGRDLDRDFAMEDGVPGEVDRAHAALAEEALDLVAVDLVAGAELDLGKADRRRVVGGRAGDRRGVEHLAGVHPGAYRPYDLEDLVQERALLGRLLEAAHDDVLELGRDALALAVVRDGGRRVLLDLPEVGDAVDVEGDVARDHLVEHHAHRVEVAGRREFEPARLLGAEVLRFPHDREDLGDLLEPVVGRLPDPEIEELRDQQPGLVLHHDDVVGGEVAVEDVAGVDLLQPLEQVIREVDEGRDPHHAAPAPDVVAELLAFEELHRDVPVAVFGAGVLDEADDVGAAGEELQDFRFPFEAAEVALGLLRTPRQKVTAQDLDRDEP